MISRHIHIFTSCVADDSIQALKDAGFGTLPTGKSTNAYTYRSDYQCYVSIILMDGTEVDDNYPIEEDRSLLIKKNKCSVYSAYGSLWRE